VLHWPTHLSSSFFTTTTPHRRRGERQNDDDNNIKNNRRQCVKQLLVHTYRLHRSNTTGHLLPCYLKTYILNTISEHQNHITADKFAKL